MIMLANHSSPTFHHWTGKYPGKVGWLVGPAASRKTKWYPWVPFAMDNDAFGAWTNGTEWSESAWLQMLQTTRANRRNAKWVLVPDVVADKEGTLERWERYAPVARQYGWDLAFAVQDGMTGKDVPGDADVIFVGGNTEWKWSTVPMWCENFPRIHVGRVNTMDRVWRCHDLGAESVDGTGWFRDGEQQSRMTKLENYFEGKRQLELLAA